MISASPQGRSSSCTGPRRSDSPQPGTSWIAESTTEEEAQVEQILLNLLGDRFYFDEHASKNKPKVVQGLLLEVYVWTTVGRYTPEYFSNNYQSFFLGYPKISPKCILGTISYLTVPSGQGPLKHTVVILEIVLGIWRVLFCCQYLSALMSPPSSVRLKNHIPST